MFSTENGNTGMVMPVSPMYSGGYGGGFGGDWGSWIILFLIFGLFGNGGFGMGGFNGGLGIDFPWLLNANNSTDALVTNGFNNASVNTALSGIQSSITSGFGDVQNSLCSGFAGVNATVNGAQNAIAQQLYTNQIADMERSFNAQTASTQGMTALQSQLAQCCCENKASVADVKYTIANEACATRANSTANTQAILDKLCALELDGYKRENDNLRQQLNMASLAASQNAQTAQIEAGQRALANEVEQYVAPNPKPAYIVSSPYCCNQNYGYACGCGA